jgi:hypothetical protein
MCSGVNRQNKRNQTNVSIPEMLTTSEKILDSNPPLGQSPVVVRRKLSATGAIDISGSVAPVLATSKLVNFHTKTGRERGER